MVLGILIGGVVGFVAGILVGRKNKHGVEGIVANSKAELAKIKGGK